MEGAFGYFSHFLRTSHWTFVTDLLSDTQIHKTLFKLRPHFQSLDISSSDRGKRNFPLKIVHLEFVFRCVVYSFFFAIFSRVSANFRNQKDHSESSFNLNCFWENRCSNEALCKVRVMRLFCLRRYLNRWNTGIFQGVLRLTEFETSWQISSSRGRVSRVSPADTVKMKAPPLTSRSRLKLNFNVDSEAKFMENYD
jgi:hypothetical protein